eukprot:2441126-Rhodomonas_salina.3
MTRMLDGPTKRDQRHRLLSSGKKGVRQDEEGVGKIAGREEGAAKEAWRAGLGNSEREKEGDASELHDSQRLGRWTRLSAARFLPWHCMCTLSADSCALFC